MKRPTCPKCGKTMVLGPKAASGNQRWECKTYANGERVYCYSTTNPKATKVTDRGGKRSKTTPIFRRTVGGATTLLVAYAQNATPVHKGFMKALEQCANHRNADILVVPGRYKNPTSRFTSSQANEEVWDDAVLPYLCNQRKRLGKNLVLLGDSKVQPTARDPLSGYEALTHGESGIVGHPQLALTTIATPQSTYPKLLTTTGACTIQNYTDSKAGRLGEFHHTIGAALVELKGKKFHLRQINASKETGSFIDLRDLYHANGETPYRAARAKVLDMGDTHTDFVSPSVVRGTFAPGGMVEFFEPEILVWHDLDDNHAVNPHHKSSFTTLAKIKAGRTCPKAELERAIAFVVEHTPANTTSYIVWSNHNEFLKRWVERTNPHDQPSNLEFWSKLAGHMAQQAKLGAKGVEVPDPFVTEARKLLEGVKNVVVLDRNDKLVVADIALHMHGHEGPNGSRGSRRNLAPIGTKSIIAHGHGPGIHRGCYQVGTSTELEAEYTSGPGSWLQTHGTINALGKRCLHNLIKGEWRI